MLSDTELESVALRMSEIMRQREDLNNELGRLKIFLNEHWPADLEKKKFDFGMLGKAKVFIKWVYTPETLEKMENEKLNGKAKKVIRDVITFYRKRI